MERGKQGVVGHCTGAPGQIDPLPHPASVHSTCVTILSQEIHPTHLTSDFTVSTGSLFQTMESLPPTISCCLHCLQKKTYISLTDLYARSLCPFEPPRCGEGREAHLKFRVPVFFTGRTVRMLRGASEAEATRTAGCPGSCRVQ